MAPASEEAIRNAIGLGLRETVERFLPSCTEEEFHRIVEAYRRLWFDSYGHRPRLFDGVAEMLSGLQRDGYLLAVATAKSRRGLDSDLEATGLRPLFVATRTMDEAHSKPHPQMILDILEELGADAKQALLIGDTSHDLQMARNAGIPAVAVCTGSHSRQGLEEEAPLACFESVVELPAWLAAQERPLPGRE